MLLLDITCKINIIRIYNIVLKHSDEEMGVITTDQNIIYLIEQSIVVLNCIVLYCIVLYCIVLCCVVLCCVMMRCVMLCCIMW